MTWLVWLLVGAVLGLNLLAWRHALGMTRFTPPTAFPERAPPVWQLWLKRFFWGFQARRSQVGFTPADKGWAFSEHRFCGYDGELAGWLIPAPDGSCNRLAVLCHQFGGSRADLLAVAEVFREEGWATLLFDFRGHGDSQGNATSLGWHEAVEVAAAVRLAREKCQPQRLILYGLSLGAVAIMRALAMNFCRADAVILESPFDSLLGTVRHRVRGFGLPSCGLAELLTWWGGVLNGFPAFAHRPVDYATRLTVPALVLHGGLDQWISRDEAATLAGRLGGWHELRIFDAAGHGELLAKYRYDWRRAVGGFLKEQVSHEPTA